MEIEQKRGDYANGILVSNCDAMIYAVNVGLAGSGSSIFDA